MNDQYGSPSTEFARYRDIIARLHEYGAPDPLAPEVLDRMTRAAVIEAARSADRRLTIQLTLLCLACLPIVGLVNAFWGTLGYSFLNEYVSPILAHAFTYVFAVSACALTAVCYGAVPLLAGLSRSNTEEKVHP